MPNNVRFSAAEKQDIRLQTFYDSVQNKDDHGQPLFDMDTINELINKQQIVWNTFLQKYQLSKSLKQKLRNSRMAAAIKNKR